MGFVGATKTAAAFCICIPLFCACGFRGDLRFKTDGGLSCSGNSALPVCQNNESSTSEPTPTPDPGNPGLEAFTNTVYAITNTRCVGCHNTTPQLPGMPSHGSDDVNIAYAAAMTKVDFANIPASAMVVRTMNGHCGMFCMTDGTEMIAAIQAWASAPGGP